MDDTHRRAAALLRIHRIKGKQMTINIYRHYKGGLYRRILNAPIFLEADLTPMVVYECISSNRIFTRPESEFKERFMRATRAECIRAKVYGDLTDDLLYKK